MASIPLAVVLVAALVVPLAVIPGTFGFSSWPTAGSEQVTEHHVLDVPLRVQLVKEQPEGAGNRRHAAVPRLAAPSDGTVAAAPTGRADVVRTPDQPASSPADGTGSGPGEQEAASDPAAPTTPAAEPQQPAAEPAPGDDQVAGDETPVLRGDGPATPAAPVDPVWPVAPSQRAGDEAASSGDREPAVTGIRGLGLPRPCVPVLHTSPA
jgi:hypothetical protein